MEPIASEPVAATRALSFALHMGFSKIILDGDALGVINQIRPYTHSLSNIENITEEAKLILKSFTTPWLVQFVRREANAAAHTLAKEALSLEHDKRPKETKKKRKTSQLKVVRGQVMTQSHRPTHTS